ncbi:MAG: peptidoglycan-binding domain-containing protein, partial [Leptolyngbyaceae bacterium]|nr:peptidoglycan-binding domain-containing protein [Leptolyngbyaceae bacterium]
RPLLRLGSQGTDVADVQAMLTLLGFYRGSINGQFDDTTTLAVANFQRAAGITVDGIVGNTTWTRLLPSVTSISRPTVNPEANPSPTPPSNSGNSGGVARPPQGTSPTSSPPTATRTPPPSDPATPYVEFPTLRRGMRGAAVIGLQARLQALGFYLGAADGIFGRQTEEAVIAAQRQFNLRPDGVVGAATWNVITGPTRN